YGLNLPKPIEDLVINEKGISAILLFHNTPFRTFVPWTAVTNMALPPEAIDTPEKQNKLRAILNKLPMLVADGAEAESVMRAPGLCAVPSDVPFDAEAQDEETAASAIQFGGRAGLSLVR